MTAAKEKMTTEKLAETVERKFGAVGEALKQVGNDLRTRVASAEKHLGEQAEGLHSEHRNRIAEVHDRLDRLDRHHKVQYLILTALAIAVIAALWL